MSHRPLNPDERDSFVLLDQYREGDAAALDTLIRRHYPRVERIVSVRLRGSGTARADIADIVQETMIKAIQNLDRFEHHEEARLVHWLARIAERQVLTFHASQLAAMRDQRKEVGRVQPQDVNASVMGIDPLAREETPSRIAAAHDERQILDECLASLPEDQREVILLREYTKATWEFVASELKRPSPDAARKLYERARITLKEKLRMRLGDGGED